MDKSKELLEIYNSEWAGGLRLLAATHETPSSFWNYFLKEGISFTIGVGKFTSLPLSKESVEYITITAALAGAAVPPVPLTKNGVDLVTLNEHLCVYLESIALRRHAASMFHRLQGLQGQEQKEYTFRRFLSAIKGLTCKDKCILVYGMEVTVMIECLKDPKGFFNEVVVK